METYLWLSALGLIVGAYGTVIGAGGGFILVPVLLLLYPTESPTIIASISLAVVFFNAFSGSLAYASLGRIDYKSGLLFGAATIPGAILGALSTAYIPRRIFDAILGLMLIAVSLFLILYPKREKPAEERKPRYSLGRKIVEKDGAVHVFSYNPVGGIILSFFVGYVSSVLGIGGGIIHVPALIHLLNFPVHVATATSHFILAIMALTGTTVHIVTGAFSRGIRRTMALAVGVLIGAQIGAILSGRFRATWIIRSLAVAIGFVGIRVLFLALR